MTNFIPKLATEAQAKANTNIAAGQLILTTDEHNIYVDTNASTRIKVSDFISLATYNDLMGISHPLDKFYFVEENYTLYKAVDGDWHQIGGADTTGFAKKYSQILSDDGNTLFNVVHNLNTTDVVVSGYDTTTGKSVWLDYTVANQNQIQIQLTTRTGTHPVKVIVVG